MLTNEEKNEVYVVILTNKCDKCHFGSMLICELFHKKEDANAYLLENYNKFSPSDEYLYRHQILTLRIK